MLERGYWFPCARYVVYMWSSRLFLFLPSWNESHEDTRINDRTPLFPLNVRCVKCSSMSLDDCHGKAGTRVLADPGPIRCI